MQVVKNTQFQSVLIIFKFVHPCLRLFCCVINIFFKYDVLSGSFYNAINWRDTTHIDSEDDYCTGCRNVSHCQQQQS